MKLIASIDPTAAELHAYDTHEATLKARINAYRLVRFGSHERGTAVRGSSDRDLMACLQKTDVTWGGRVKSSSTVLDAMRADLDAHLPSVVSRADCAVVVSFSGGKSVDVVPAVFEGMINTNYGTRPAYSIPDGAGGWRPTSPETHALYIEDANRRSGGKVRNVARIVKYLRETRQRQLSLSSFHVELVLAGLASYLVGRSYAECVHTLLATLVARNGSALRDPLQIGSPIEAASSDAKRAALMITLKDAARNAALALDAEQNRTMPEAYARWDMVFNGAFPKSN